MLPECKNPDEGLPNMDIFEIPSKLLTISKISNLESDLKLISKWLRKSHFSFPDAAVFDEMGDFHLIFCLNIFNWSDLTIPHFHSENSPTTYPPLSPGWE